jgi:hypothetical protein
MLSESELRIITSCAAQLHSIMRAHETQQKVLGIVAEEREAKAQVKQNRLIAQAEVLRGN